MNFKKRKVILTPQKIKTMPASTLEQDPKLAQIREWFESFIDHVHLDQIMIETRTAPKEINEIYNTLMNGQALDIAVLNRNAGTSVLITLVVRDYLSELAKTKKLPIKLALNYSYAKILVWAEIKNDDEQTEDALLITEAIVNAKYYPHGYSISTTIVEQSDNLSIPPHYKTIKTSSRK